MAEKLLAPNYKTSFTDGQGGGIANYDEYPEDHSANYVAIQTSVNALVDESKGVSGPNTLIPLDLILATNPAVTNGFVGEHSYDATISGSPNDDQIDISAGTFYIDVVGRVSLSSPLNLSIVGLSPGTVYINLNSSGLPSRSNTINSEIIDIWAASWDGTNLTALTRLQPVIPDGDDFQDCLSVVGDATAGLPNQDHNKIADRLENIERKLRGLQGASSNIISSATNLGPLAIGGVAAGAPGLILSDGAGTYDATSGLFRQAANVMGATISGTEVWQTLAAAFRVATGSVALPPIAGIADPDTGIRFSGSNILQLITKGIVAISINDSQQRTSATQGRFAATEVTVPHSHTDNGNWQDVVITDSDEIYDVGEFHSGSTALCVVPSADYAGNYSFKAWVRFESGAAGIRGIRIMVGAIVIAESTRGAAASGTSASSASADSDLVNADEVKIQVFQNASASEDYEFRFSFRKED